MDLNHETTRLRRLGVRSEEEKAPTGSLSGHHGAGCAVAGHAGNHQAPLSERWQWPASDAAGTHAADLLLPTLVQSVRPGDGRCAVRHGVDPPLRLCRAWRRRGTGRKHHSEIPSFVGKTRADPE